MEVAASGIAVFQAASSVVKSINRTRELWRQVKDVPEEIAELIDELELLEPLFSTIEAQFNSSDMLPPYWDATYAMMSLDRCRRAHATLSEMILELDARLSSKKGAKRMVAAAKILPKRASIDRYKSRLSASIRLLQYAHGCLNT